MKSTHRFLLLAGAMLALGCARDAQERIPKASEKETNIEQFKHSMDGNKTKMAEDAFGAAAPRQDQKEAPDVEDKR